MRYRLLDEHGQIMILEGPAGLFRPGDRVRLAPLPEPIIIGGLPTREEMAEERAVPARPAAASPGIATERQGLAVAGGPGRGLPSRHGALADPAELIAAASAPGMSLRRLRREHGIGYSRARRLLRQHNPAWGKENGHE